MTILCEVTVVLLVLRSHVGIEERMEALVATVMVLLAAVDFSATVFSLLPTKLGGADGAPARAVTMDVLLQNGYS